MDHEKIAEFAIYCTLHQNTTTLPPDPRHIVKSHVITLQRMYRTLFDADPPVRTVVKVVFNGAVQEHADEPGVFFHCMGLLADNAARVRAVLAHLEIPVFALSVHGVVFDAWRM